MTMGVAPVNSDQDTTRQPKTRYLAVPADHAMRPLIVPMLGTSIGLLFVVIRNLIQLFT